MIARISQAQADDAAADAAAFWPEFGGRWSWTRAAEFARVYQQVGEQTVSLLRAFPAIQWSNQARWYRRVVRDTPAILALTPDALQAEAGTLTTTTSLPSLEGKHAISVIYLPDASGQSEGYSASEPPVAKTLLASTALDAPYYTSQLAHELLNCFCHTSWDGEVITNGLRRSQTNEQSRAESGAALNDLLLDAMLVHYLPAVGVVSSEELFEGTQGAYWRIAQTLSTRLRGVPALPALFSGETDAITRFERGLTLALDTADAAAHLDTLASAHDWVALRRALGDSD